MAKRLFLNIFIGVISAFSVTVFAECVPTVVGYKKSGTNNAPQSIDSLCSADLNAYAASHNTNTFRVTSYFTQNHEDQTVQGFPKKYCYLESESRPSVEDPWQSFIDLQGSLYDPVVQCIEPEPECPTGEERFWSSPTNDASACVGNCTVTAAGVGVRIGSSDWLLSGETTGESCTSGSVPAAPDGCIVGASGNQICVTDPGQNCGTYNDQPYCAESIPTGECEFFGNGDYVCNGNPAPEDQPVDGEGDPVTHEDEWEQGDPASPAPFFGGTGSAPSGDPDGGGEDPPNECDPQSELCGGTYTSPGGLELPEVNEQQGWWESSYPDGLAGVWASHEAELMATPVVTWLNSWQFSASGSCPSWSFNLNLGPLGNYGAASLNVPCWLWDTIGTIMIISALLLARRLVFGG